MALKWGAEQPWHQESTPATAATRDITAYYIALLLVTGHVDVMRLMPPSAFHCTNKNTPTTVIMKLFTSAYSGHMYWHSTAYQCKASRGTTSSDARATCCHHACSCRHGDRGHHGGRHFPCCSLCRLAAYGPTSCPSPCDK